MSDTRGDVWWGTLDPTQGSGQAGRRPVVIIQNDAINACTSTFLAIPLTSNLRRTQLPSSVLAPRGVAGLAEASVVLCHQLRVLDRQRLVARVGALDPELLLRVEATRLFPVGIADGGSVA